MTLVHSADGVVPTETETDAFSPDPDMCGYELDILRIMNGEDVPGVCAGAGMWVAAAWLKGRGYAEGHYAITAKGRSYLAALSEACERAEAAIARTQGQDHG